MSSACSIRELQFRDGTKVAIPANAIVLLVGPNNVGKSQVLKEIQTLVARSKGGSLLVLEDIQSASSATFDDFLAAFGDHVVRHPPHTYFTLPGDDSGDYAGEEDVAKAVKVGRGYRALAPLIVKSLSTEARLTIVRPPPNLKYR